eukprot:746628-Hanusia_phi.AAC.1
MTFGRGTEGRKLPCRVGGVEKYRSQGGWIYHARGTVNPRAAGRQDPSRTSEQGGGRGGSRQCMDFTGSNSMGVAKLEKGVG